jgi:formylglycine-generating enzyme required for sulfatase activity
MKFKITNMPKIYTHLLIFFVGSMLVSGVIAQTRGVGVRVKTSDGQTKEITLYRGSYALVIGNSVYSNGWDDLAGVKSDVTAVSEALTKHGFQVETAENLNGRDFLDRVNKFINDYGFEPNNRLLIYYAGHGHTLAATGDDRKLGYVVPVDAPNPKIDRLGFLKLAVPMDTIQSFAKRIQSKHALFLFDSCFSGKLVTRNAITVPPVIEEKVSLAVRQFITAGAEDQPVPDESIFRRSFVTALAGEGDSNQDGYITGTELAEYLKQEVTNASQRSQTPQYGKIRDVNLDRGDFVFVTGKAPATVAADTAVIKNDPNAAERLIWEQIRESREKSDFASFLQKYPDGIFAAQAKSKYEQVWWDSIKDSTDPGEFERFIKNFPTGTYGAAARFNLRRMAGSGKVRRPEIKAEIKAGPVSTSQLPRGAEMKFAYIPAGEFYMGSETGDEDESKIRRVKITRGFWMGIYEVTQAQWEAVMKKRPSNFSECGGNCPVERVSWQDVQKFIEKLNESSPDGYRYRLPTEAEWEYAARAGTSGDFAGEIDAMAWHQGNSGNKTHPVGQKSPNGWGLYDMHGNVWEWVQDLYGDYEGETVTDPTGVVSSPSRVVRGGGWSNPESFQRSANRSNSSATNKFGYLGFRLVRIGNK